MKIFEYIFLATSFRVTPHNSRFLQISGKFLVIKMIQRDSFIPVSKADNFFVETTFQCVFMQIQYKLPAVAVSYLIIIKWRLSRSSIFRS